MIAFAWAATVGADFALLVTQQRSGSSELLSHIHFPHSQNGTIVSGGEFFTGSSPRQLCGSTFDDYLTRPVTSLTRARLACCHIHAPHAKPCMLSTKLMDFNVYPSLEAQREGTWLDSWMGKARAATLLCHPSARVILLERNSTLRWCSLFFSTATGDYTSHIDTSGQRHHPACDRVLVTAHPSEEAAVAVQEEEWFTWVKKTLYDCGQAYLLLPFHFIVNNYPLVDEAVSFFMAI